MLSFAEAQQKESFMTYPNALTSDFLDTFKINIYEPFSDFLMGSKNENNFQLSFLDVVKFAGHACPSMTGAFLITRAAIDQLYPDTKVGVRGQIEIDIPESPTSGPIGPMANVFSFITGAWGETGFGGFQNGDFNRRNLLHFNSKKIPIGTFRFTRVDTGKIVDITYQSSNVPIEINPEMPFQLQWRVKIRSILENPNLAIHVTHPDK